MTDLASSDATSLESAYGELVDNVRAVFRSGRTRPAEWRRGQLEALLALLTEHEAELVEAIQSDLGRPVAEAFVADIGHARLQIKHVLKHFESWMKPKRMSAGFLSQPASAEQIHEPLGVCLIIAPWNYPIQLLVEPMAAAIAAGNAVVVKPSELAPACAAVMARLIPHYLDDEAVVVVEGAVAETTALLSIPFDHIFFTGSTNVGKVVMSAAAKHLTPVVLELGGKSPTIVAADADLEVAARRIAWAKCLNTGQTCIAPDYVLVEASVAEELVQRIADALERYYTATPSSSPDLGRIINHHHFDRLVGLADTAGGTLICGGTHDRESKFFAPTVIINPDLDSPLMQEEIFGPILPVISVPDVDAAIEMVNDRPKPLALYVFSKSPETADRVLERTSSGGACVNHLMMHLVPEGLPFGGVGPSGMGSYHGRSGFDAFSHHKSVLRKSTRPDPTMLYPPFSSAKVRLLKRVFR